MPLVLSLHKLFSNDSLTIGGQQQIKRPSDPKWTHKHRQWTHTNSGDGCQLSRRVGFWIAMRLGDTILLLPIGGLHQ